MNKIKNFFKSSFVKDLINNTFAFGLYIVSIHAIFMPYMAKQLEVSDNAKLLFFVMVSNILTLSLGQELGILYQVKNRELSEESEADFRNLSWKTNVLMFIFMFVLLFFLKEVWVNAPIFSLLESLAFALVSVLTGTKFYYQGLYRNEKRFKSIGIINSIFLGGILVGILLFHLGFKHIWLTLFIAEGASNLYIVFDRKLLGRFSVKKTSDYKGLRNSYLDLSFATLLTNFPTYADKLLILPLLGDAVMSSYYAGTVVSKILFFLVNPINGVLLAHLTSDDSLDQGAILKKQIKANLLVVLLTFLVSLPLIYVATFILYKQFLPQVLSILIPLAVIATFSVASCLLRVLFLTFKELKFLKYINILHILAFIFFGVLGALFFGLPGFAYGIGLSKIILWASFYILLKKGAETEQPAP